MRLLIFATLLAASPALAQRVTLDVPSDMNRWVLVATGLAAADGEVVAGGEINVYLDTRTAIRRGDTVMAWTWWTMARVVPANGGVPAYDRTLRHEQYNCRIRSWIYLNVYYHRSGVPVLSYTFPSDQLASPWWPESLDEVIGDEVCARVG